MTWYLVTWISWACVGDVDVFGLAVRPVPTQLRSAAALVAPPPAREPICRAIPQRAIVSSRSEALRRVRTAGVGGEPRLEWCQRLRCWEKKLEWRPELYVDGRKEI